MLLGKQDELVKASTLHVSCSSSASMLVDFHRVAITINSKSFIKWIEEEYMIHEFKGQNNKVPKSNGLVKRHIISCTTVYSTYWLYKNVFPLLVGGQISINLT